MLKVGVPFLKQRDRYAPAFRSHQARPQNGEFAPFDVPGDCARRRRSDLSASQDCSSILQRKRLRAGFIHLLTRVFPEIECHARYRFVCRHAITPGEATTSPGGVQGRPIPWRKAQGTSVKSWGQNHRCSLSEACLDCPIATAGLRLFRGPWPVALVGHRSCGLTINFFKSSAPQACFLAKLAQLSHTLAARHRIETRSSRLPVAGIQR